MKYIFTLRAAEDSGAIGLDMGFTDEIGPLPVRNLAVEGCELGINTKWPVNSATFEHVTLRGQRKHGWWNCILRPGKSTLSRSVVRTSKSRRTATKPGTDTASVAIKRPDGRTMSDTIRITVKSRGEVLRRSPPISLDDRLSIHPPEACESSTRCGHGRSVSDPSMDVGLR